MNIEAQEQKFRHSLDQLVHSTTQLTNTLVSSVVESSPQLYVKTTLHLMSCIGALSQEVEELQQAWNELTFYRKKGGLASTEEESVSLPKEKRKSVKRTAESESTSNKRGRKKAVSEPSSVPVEIPIPLEEQIHDQINTDT